MAGTGDLVADLRRARRVAIRKRLHDDAHLYGFTADTLEALAAGATVDAPGLQTTLRQEAKASRRRKLKERALLLERSATAVATTKKRPGGKQRPAAAPGRAVSWRWPILGSRRGR